MASPMQAGKTSSYVYLAEQMLERGMIENVFVISGISDNALRDQTYERIGHIGRVYFLHSLAQKAEGNRISALREFSSSLIVIDESHIGADVESSLYEFLSLIGIGGDGTFDETLYPSLQEGTGESMSTRMPYVLSVSATPYAEVAASERKMIVPHIPGPNYVGLGDLNLINIIDPYSPQGQLGSAFEELQDTRTYAIVRSLQAIRFRLPGGGMVVIPHDDNAARRYVQTLGYPIIYVDMENETDLPAILEREPEEFTIILIKKYARAGQTFSKRYVSLVWEIFGRADEQAQGLPGRMCGYDPSAKDVRVYCNLRLIQQHMDWKLSEYSRLNLPSSGKNIQVTQKAGTALPEFQKIGVFDTLDQVEDAYREYGYVNMPQFRVHQGNRVWTEEEMVDEKGRIMQYLPVNGNGEERVKAWPLDYMVNFLTEVRPLMGAIETPNGMRTSVAKIAYRDIDDPSTRVYVLYYYDGPLSQAKVEATTNSMYVHSASKVVSGNSGIVQQIQIDPARVETEEGRQALIADMIPIIYQPLSLVITATGVEDTERVAQIMKEVTRLTLQDLQWRAYISPALQFLRPYLIERKELNVPFYTPANQPDTARFIIDILAPNIDAAMTGYDLDRHTLTRYLWPYRRSLSVYLTTTRNLPGIGRYRQSGINYYYSLRDE